MQNGNRDYTKCAVCGDQVKYHCAHTGKNFCSLACVNANGKGGCETCKEVIQQ
jgi:HIT zinc finger protein